MHDMFTEIATIPQNGSPLTHIHGLVPTSITFCTFYHQFGQDILRGTRSGGDQAFSFTFVSRCSPQRYNLVKSCQVKICDVKMATVFILKTSPKLPGGWLDPSGELPVWDHVAECLSLHL